MNPVNTPMNQPLLPEPSTYPSSPSSITLLITDYYELLRTFLRCYHLRALAQRQAVFSKATFDFLKRRLTKVRAGQ